MTRLFELAAKLPGKKMPEEERQAWRPLAVAMVYCGALKIIGAIVLLLVVG